MIENHINEHPYKKDILFVSDKANTLFVTNSMVNFINLYRYKNYVSINSF